MNYSIAVPGSPRERSSLQWRRKVQNVRPEGFNLLKLLMDVHLQLKYFAWLGIGPKLMHTKIRSNLSIFLFHYHCYITLSILSQSFFSPLLPLPFCYHHWKAIFVIKALL